MQRETSSSESTAGTSYVVVLSERSSAFLDQQGVTNAGLYIRELLIREKQRQDATGADKRPRKEEYVDNLNEFAPDASGYPNLKDNFTNRGNSWD